MARYSKEQIQEFISEYHKFIKQGMTSAQAYDKVGVSKSTLFYWMNPDKLKLRNKIRSEKNKESETIIYPAIKTRKPYTKRIQPNTSSSIITLVIGNPEQVYAFYQRINQFWLIKLFTLTQGP